MADPTSAPVQQQDDGSGTATSEASHQNQPRAAASVQTVSMNPAPVTTPFSSTLSQPFTMKLDRHNFPVWKTMVFTIIRGHRLEGFINGKRVCPEEFITSGTPETTDYNVIVNPDYENWLVHDQLLMGWLYGSMTEGIASEVMGCQSAYSLWTALENLFGAYSRAHTDDLRTKLQTTRKGSTSMTDYLKQKRMWADSLALAGEPYPERHLVSNVLSGLEIEYLSIVSLIEARSETSWQELQSILLSFDNRLERLTATPPAHKNLNSPSPNIAHKPTGAEAPCTQTEVEEADLAARRQLAKSVASMATLPQRCYNRYDESYMGHQPPGEPQQDKQFNALVATPQILNDDSWYVDSGASNHLTAEEGQMSNKSVYGGSSDRKVVLLQGALRDGLYRLDTSLLQDSRQTCPRSRKSQLESFAGVVTATSKSNKINVHESVLDLWHRRLGHPSNVVLSQVLKTSNVIPAINEKLLFCDACQYGKSHCLPFKNSSSRASQVLELVHTDLWGPAPINSHTNSRFYIHFVDDHSRYTWLFPLKHKSDALSAFVQFKALVENQFNRKIKALRTDWGGEFQSFTDIVTQNGIVFQHSCPHTSEQNGRAERKHRHIVEMGLTLLAQASMPLKYWTDAFHTAVHLINRLPTTVLGGKSPYEVLFSKTPDYHTLKVFGPACFPCLRSYQTHKFQYHSVKCVNLGYSQAHKGFRCVSPHGRIYITRHIIFNENEFPCKSGFFNNYKSEQVVTLDAPHSWFILPSAPPLYPINEADHGTDLISSTTPKNPQQLA
ncbi:uncharacterized protein LOC133034535 [Cannabis sativa]|uniref:uncharacterized protein LOC133034535 n=1 Tax=Cannabis sativa TaxID=3483 RepID=UPI0029CA25F0|nr:uncharacterized protein LOC133034535 [Cannabis sativa]